MAFIINQKKTCQVTGTGYGDQRGRGRMDHAGREGISARRRAAAARRHRLSQGDHGEKWGRLQKKMDRQRISSHKSGAETRTRSLSAKPSFRLIKVLLLALCLAGILCFNPLPGFFHPAGGQVNASVLTEDIVYEVIEVKKGDTLWSIAGEYYKPEYRSIPAFIEMIKECNHMENDRIYAGSYLMVPRK